MVQSSERLERLLIDEIGACCEEDVERRLEALERYAASVPPSIDSDLRSLKLIADETRYTIVHLLAAADRELCVCEITPVVDVSDSAVSHALSDLRDGGLVTRRKRGTWRYYRPTERAEALLEVLDETRGTHG